MIPPFVVNIGGTPRPQPRPRFVNGRVVSTANPKAKLWRALVERHVKAAIANRGQAVPLFGGAVRVRLAFTFRPPASAMARCSTPHTHTPDADNLSKGPLDVLKACGVYADDSQAAQAPPEKWWGEKPGLSIVVEDISAERRVSRADPDAPDWLTAG